MATSPSQMTPESFSLWLQGYVELTNGAYPTQAQWQSICDHLKLVFTKVTPDRVAPSEPNILCGLPSSLIDPTLTDTIISHSYC